MRTPILAGLLLLLASLVAPGGAADAADAAGGAALTEEERAFLRAHGPLRVLLTPTGPPYELEGADGVSRGINADFLALVSVKTGIEFRIERADSFPRLYAAIENGTADAYGPSVQTSDREDELAWTSPYAWARFGFWVADPSIQAPEDLAGRRVGVPANPVHEAFLHERHPDLVQVPVDDVEEGVHLLARGEIDALYGGYANAGYYARNAGFTHLRTLGDPEQVSEVRWAVKRGNDVVLSIMEKGLASLTPEERLAIYVKWTGQDLGPPEAPQPFSLSAAHKAVLAGAAAVLAALAAGVLLLRAQVRARTRELRASNDLLAAVVESTGDGIFAKDEEGRYLLANRAAARDLGLAGPREAVGLRDVDVLPEAIRERVRTADAEVLRTGAARVDEVEVEADGETRVVQTTRAPLRDGPGRVRGVVGVARDVTEERRMRDQVAQSRDFYLTLFDSFPALVWRSGTDARCDYFNQTWLRFTGRTLEEERGDGWAEGVHPEDADACVSTYLAAFAKREPFEMEYRLRRHDGEYRWILDRGAPYHGLDGAFAGYIGTGHDVTERREAEARAKAEAITRGLVQRMLRELSRGSTGSDRAMRELGRSLGRAASGHGVRPSLDAFANMGLGGLLVESDGGDRYVFGGSDLLERVDHANQPTCHLALGFVEGAVEAATGRAALGSETACQSVGHAACRFIVQVRQAEPTVASAGAAEGRRRG